MELFDEIQAGNVAALKQLLQSGYDPNKQVNFSAMGKNYSLSTVHHAVIYDQRRCLKELIAADVDVQATARIAERLPRPPPELEGTT